MRILAVVLALSQGAVCLSAPDTMLCLHRDGKVRVEPLAPSCCRGELAPDCPDEDCQDLPVVESSPIDAPAAAPIVLETCSLPADLPADPCRFGPVPRLERPRSFSGPPPPGPEQHLKTVILRR